MNQAERKRSRKEKLRFAVRRYVEMELRDYPENKKELTDLRMDIIEAAPITDEAGGNSPQTTNRVSNPTYTKTLKLVTNKRLIQIERTIKAIEKVLNGLDRDKYRLVEMTYFERKLTPVGIAEKLHISERTYYNWKEDIITAIAVEMGLINAADML